MLEETMIIKSKAIFSDDKEHRLLLRKEWNSEKPSAMVIMIIAIQQIIAHNHTNETTLCSPLDELLKILLKWLMVIPMQFVSFLSLKML